MANMFSTNLRTYFYDIQTTYSVYGNIYQKVYTNLKDTERF